ncbi:MAG: archease [Euryarchaeota archaeon]|nr:archease [Euryarchaeota archaeon]
MEKPYEVIDHTADIGIIVRGNTVEELFEKAAYAMFDLITDAEKIDAIGKYRVSVSSPTLEDLLVDYLSELLYVFSVEYCVMCDFNVIIHKTDDGYFLKGVALGEPLNKEKHNIKLEIKAVTYHELEINLKEGYAKVLFDI